MKKLKISDPPLSIPIFPGKFDHCSFELVPFFLQQFTLAPDTSKIFSPKFSKLNAFTVDVKCDF